MPTPAPSQAVRPLMAGNWKMNGLKAQLEEARRIAAAIGVLQPASFDALICPPATLVAALAQSIYGTALKVGAQDCHVSTSGAYTGDVSAEMLKDAGAEAVIVGHSERRTDHAETDRLVHAKAMAAHRASLVAIVCVGETAGERSAGLMLDVVGRQIAGSLPETATASNTVVAYEPVWAIGTGLTPTLADVADVHAYIRKALGARFGAEGMQMRILYGGSVKPGNARDLLSVVDVNGALVGGASLKAADFLAIIDAYQA